MPDENRWQRLDALLDELLDLDPERRRARLDALEGDDAALRPELERLLAADQTASTGVLDRGVAPLAGVLGDAAEHARPGHHIGPYRVIRELGRGGMGHVLLAERVGSEFEHQVALKIVSAGANRAEIVARFKRERRILAKLRHPNIAALYDGGAGDDGLPWFAMEYVAGERITDWCDSHRLGIDARIELFESVCHAVQYAHRNLVVHRDLKPSNVFVTSDGTPKLLDFGIGKLLDPESPDETQHTQGFLTPAFAAPEQIRGEATSTSTDVFSLGMLLYVLLTGQHPHGDTSRSVEIVRAIAEEEPPEPSSMVTRDTTTATANEMASCRSATPGELRRRLRGDLDNIVAKALRKNPEARYTSAQDLAADLERYRKSLPVSARAPTARYRARKYLRRHRVGVTAAAVALVCLFAGVGGVLWQAGVASRERDRARAVKDYLIEVFSSADPTYETGQSLTAVELVERGAARVSERFDEDPAIRAEINGVLGAVLTNLAQHERADEVLTAALEQHRAQGDAAGMHETLIRMGESAYWQGDLRGGIARFEEALTIARRQFGSRDARTAQTLHKIGELYTELGLMEESGRYNREALEMAREVFDPRSQEIASFYLGLGGHHYANGELEEAVEMTRRGVDALRASGTDGVRLSDGLSSLGFVLGQRGLGAESEQVLRESVAVLRREYGDEGHPKLAQALGNLGGTLMRADLAESSDLDRLAESEACFREAQEIYIRHLGADSWLVGQNACNIAVIKTKQGDIVAAGELLRESVRITEAALGDRHPILGAPLSNLARNYLRQKQYAEAEVAYDRAISFAREVFGEGHPNVAHPLMGLVDLYLETGRAGQAEPVAREGLEIRAAALGADHPLVLETHVQLATILEAVGRPGEAVDTLRAAIANARKGPGTRPVLATALLACARIERGRDVAPETISPLLEEALAIRREEYGDDDERTREVLEEIAHLETRPPGRPSDTVD